MGIHLSRKKHPLKFFSFWCICLFLCLCCVCVCVKPDCTRSKRCMSFLIRWNNKDKVACSFSQRKILLYTFLQSKDSCVSDAVFDNNDVSGKDGYGVSDIRNDQEEDADFGLKRNNKYENYDIQCLLRIGLNRSPECCQHRCQNSRTIASEPARKFQGVSSYILKKKVSGK